MIHAVLFDLDGTLLDRDASLHLFIESQYERFSPALGHVPKQQYIERFTALDAHGYVWKDIVYKALVKEFRITGITADELLTDYIANFRNHCVPFTGLAEMLSELQFMGIRLGLITNGRTAFQLGNIRALGIEHFFDAVLISEQEGMKKPDPRIFRKALQLLDTAPTGSCFVGDHPVNDVQAAQSVGMAGIWKKNVGWTAGDAEYIIDELSELPYIVSHPAAEWRCQQETNAFSRNSYLWKPSSD